MRILGELSVCLVIDIQKKLYPHMTNHASFIKSTEKLIKGIKVLEIPLIITQQYTKGLGETIDVISKVIGQYEPIEKLSFSCCDNPDFLKKLESLNKRFVIIAGIESHVCVCQTVTDLIEKNYIPVIVVDCISSREDRDRKYGIKRMEMEGAILTTTEAILFELCRNAGNEKFKQLSNIIK